MHLANHYYGHDAILRRWAGVADDRPIAGMLQHGWNRRTGFTPNDPPAPLRRIVPCFVWNRQNLEEARSVGYGAVTAIGAPFLYLERVEPLAESSPSPGPALAAGAPAGRGPAGGVVAYPFHAWERESKTGGSHAHYAREIAEREGPVTVCLYWLEHDDPATRSAYEEQGHDVITHGYREDPRFLPSQFAVLQRHRRMITNRVSSALWYAGALGLELEVYGPEMALTRKGLTEGSASHRRAWPELFQGPVAPDRARDLSRVELGGAFLRDPDELATLLGFRGPRRGLAALAPVSRTLMRIKARIEG